MTVCRRILAAKEWAMARVLPAPSVAAVQAEDLRWYRGGC